MPVPTKAEQIAEANARTASGADSPADRQAALDVIDDVASGPDDRGTRHHAPVDADQPQRQAPQPRQDDKRNEIVARFRAHRDERNEADREDISDFARSGMPPEFDQYREDAAAAPAPADTVPPAPAEAVEQSVEETPKVAPRIKLKVHGEEKEYALDEVIAEAQKSLAAENILGKAKTTLQEANELLAVTRDRVARPDQTGHHTDQTRTQPTDASTQGDDPPTSDPYAKLIEDIQFGDPNDAQQLLRKTITDEASRAATQHIQADRMKNEGVRAGKVIADFSKDHPEVAADRYANAVMQMRIFEIQKDDLEKLGVTADSLQTALGRAPTPGDISEAHKWYRSEGYEIHNPETMLTKAYDHFLTWKGHAKTDPNPQPADPERAPPRVEVNVDRTVRKAAIPQSPTRTAAPLQAPQGQPPAQRRDPSLVVQQMQQRRNGPRGIAV